MNAAPAPVVHPNRQQPAVTNANSDTATGEAAIPGMQMPREATGTWPPAKQQQDDTVVRADDRHSPALLAEARGPVPKGYFSRSSATILRDRTAGPAGSSETPPASPRRWAIWTDGRTTWRTDESQPFYPIGAASPDEASGHKLWRATGNTGNLRGYGTAAQLRSSFTGGGHGAAPDLARGHREGLQQRRKHGGSNCSTPSYASPDLSPATPIQLSPNASRPTSPRSGAPLAEQGSTSLAARGPSWEGPSSRGPPAPAASLFVEPPTSPRTDLSSSSPTSSPTSSNMLTPSFAPSTPPSAQHRPNQAPDPDALHQLAMRSAQFDLRNQITMYEVVKYVILLPWALIKIMLLVIYVPLFALVVNGLYSWGPRMLWWFGLLRRPYAEPGVLPEWYRNIIRGIIRLGATLLLAVFNFFPWACVRGMANLKRAQRERTLLLYNHQSVVDPVLLVALMGPGGLAKSGVASIPFLNALPRALGFLFVQRKGTGDQRTKHTIRGSAASALAGALQEGTGPLLMVAPEGTTKAQDVLLRFHTGAFVPGYPVTPVLIKYRWRHFSPNFGIYASTYWFAARLLLQVVNVAEITILPPYYPSPAERSDPKLYASNMRQLMSRELGFPLVDEGVAEQAALMDNGVTLSWRGHKMVGPW